MNTIILILFSLFTIMDSILISRYEKKIKKLTNENKDLKKLIENFEVE